jgi:hypothetical protein
VSDRFDAADEAAIVVSADILLTDRAGAVVLAPTGKPFASAVPPLRPAHPPKPTESSQYEACVFVLRSRTE